MTPLNEKLSLSLREIADLLEIQGVRFKPAAFRKAANSIEALETDIGLLYKENGISGIKEIPGVGKSIASQIEEYIKRKKIRYLEELKKETAIQKIIAHFFETKGVSLRELKESAKKRKIIYSRYTKPAKQLLDLAGGTGKALSAITTVSVWAKSRNLDYTIETVFKKWLELDRLKPKELVKKPFYQGNPMAWSETKKKWFVITEEGQWLEFAGEDSDVEWKIPQDPTHTQI
jgi:hypothetical protein